MEIYGLASEISSMLSNLLNNALEACSNADPVIQVAVSKIGDIVEVTIQDNGIGIPTEKVTSYLHGESSKHSGFGLGLSSAKKYMEESNGKLVLSSKPNVGTAITLQFKVVDER